MTNEIPLIDIENAAKTESEELSYMQMPSMMDTFEIPILPEAEEVEAHPEVMALLGILQEALDEYDTGKPNRTLPLKDLSDEARILLQQIIGEGEVGLQMTGNPQVSAQETVLAGVWWVRRHAPSEAEWLEVGALPAAVLDHAFDDCEFPSPEFDNGPEDLLNAAPVVTELLDTATEHAQKPREQAHVINLSLLPFSPADHQFLIDTIGIGHVMILSRGYGNCRITSTKTPGIWRVQYFNSTDKLILDTIEVINVPLVACAAPEDLEDSAERLHEMREALA